MFKSIAQLTSLSESDSSISKSSSATSSHLFVSLGACTAEYIANRSRDRCSLATGRRACIGRTGALEQPLVLVPHSSSHLWVRESGVNLEDSCANMLPRSLFGLNAFEDCPCMAVTGSIRIPLRRWRSMLTSSVPRFENTINM